MAAAVPPCGSDGGVHTTRGCGGLCWDWSPSSHGAQGTLGGTLGTRGALLCAQGTRWAPGDLCKRRISDPGPGGAGRPCPMGVGEQWGSRPPPSFSSSPGWESQPSSSPLLHPSVPPSSPSPPPFPLLSIPSPSPLLSISPSSPFPLHPIPSPLHPIPPAMPGRDSGEFCKRCAEWKVPIGAALQNLFLHLRVRRSQRRGPPPGLTFPARAEAVTSHRAAPRARPARPRGGQPLR